MGLALFFLGELKERKGVCDEFSNLGAAILRARGIPTRMVIGVTFDGINWGNHAWIEVLQPDLGWIPSDPTFREAGYVDGTHIKMGSFNDVTLGVAKAILPSNAQVVFDDPTLPEVNIIENTVIETSNSTIVNPLLLLKFIVISFKVNEELLHLSNLLDWTI